MDARIRALGHGDQIEMFTGFPRSGVSSSLETDSNNVDFIETELAAELYCDEVVDGSGKFQYLDRVVSVSAVTETGNPSVPELDQKGFEQREIHNMLCLKPQKRLPPVEEDPDA